MEGAPHFLHFLLPVILFVKTDNSTSMLITASIALPILAREFSSAQPGF
jgi:hypothetical protein